MMGLTPVLKASLSWTTNKQIVNVDMIGNVFRTGKHPNKITE